MNKTVTDAYRRLSGEVLRQAIIDKSQDFAAFLISDWALMLAAFCNTDNIMAAKGLMSTNQVCAHRQWHWGHRGGK